MAIAKRNTHSLTYFGKYLAILLLALYLAIVFYMVYVVVTHGSKSEPFPDFGDGLKYIVTTIGGLVSALVISRLAISDPEKGPEMKRMNVTDGREESDPNATMISKIYLWVWVAIGCSCLIIGVICYPDSSDTVSDIGTSWLGLAIAASYSYFGIRPGDGS